MRIVRVVPLLLLLSLAFPLAAQEVEPFFLGGLASGTGDLGRDTDPGWSLAGGIDFPLRMWPGLGLGATGSHTRIPYGGGFDERAGVTSLMAELRYVIGYDQPWVAKPYLRAGAGIVVERYAPGRLDANPSSVSRRGFAAGAGVRFETGPVTGLLGGRFVSAGDSGFFTVGAGLGFPFGGID